MGGIKIADRGCKTAVAFDLDGLMFETERVHRKAADILLKRRGYAFTPELGYEIMGRTPEDNLRMFIERFSLTDTLDSLVEETVKTTVELLQEEGYATMPGLLELFEILDEYGTPRCVCSSGLAPIVHEILRKHDMINRVDFVLTCQDVTRGKPDPEIYLKAAERLMVEPSQTLVLEDSAAGAASATAAGATCCMLRAAHNRNSDFSKAAAVVERLDAPELLAFLTPRAEQ